MKRIILSLLLVLAGFVITACSESEATTTDKVSDFENTYSLWLGLGGLDVEESDDALDAARSVRGTNSPSGNINGWYRHIINAERNISYTQDGDNYVFTVDGNLALRMRLHFDGSTSSEWVEGTQTQYHLQRHVYAHDNGDSLVLDHIEPVCGGVNATSLIVTSITFTNETTGQVVVYSDNICESQITPDTVFKVHDGDFVSILVEATNTRTINNTDYLWFGLPLAVYAHTHGLKVEWYRTSDTHMPRWHRFPLIYDSGTGKWQARFQVRSDQPHRDRRLYHLVIDLIDAETLGNPDAEHMSYSVSIPIIRELVSQ